MVHVWPRNPRISESTKHSNFTERCGFWFMLDALEFGVRGFGFRAKGSEFTVQGLWLTVYAP